MKPQERTLFSSCISSSKWGAIMFAGFTVPQQRSSQLSICPIQTRETSIAVSCPRTALTSTFIRVVSDSIRVVQVLTPSTPASSSILCRAKLLWVGEIAKFPVKGLGEPVIDSVPSTRTVKLITCVRVLPWKGHFLLVSLAGLTTRASRGIFMVL